MSFLLESLWLSLFSPIPVGHTPQPIFTQNGLNDVGSRKDVPFGVKIATFCNHWPQDLQTAKIFSILAGTRCQIFVQSLALKILMSGVGEIWCQLIKTTATSDHDAKFRSNRRQVGEKEDSDKKEKGKDK